MRRRGGGANNCATVAGQHRLFVVRRYGDVVSRAIFILCTRARSCLGVCRLCVLVFVLRQLSAPFAKVLKGLLITLFKTTHHITTTTECVRRWWLWRRSSNSNSVVSSSEYKNINKSMKTNEETQDNTESPNKIVLKSRRSRSVQHRPYDNREEKGFRWNIRWTRQCRSDVNVAFYFYTFLIVEMNWWNIRLTVTWMKNNVEVISM